MLIIYNGKFLLNVWYQMSKIAVAYPCKNSIFQAVPSIIKTPYFHR